MTSSTGSPPSSSLGPAWQGWQRYNDFEESVKSSSRYVRSRDAELFLDEVRSSCSKREIVVPKGKIFWRARPGCEFEQVSDVQPDITVVHEEERPYGRQGMKPIPNWQTEGRANTRGIPSLYIATSRDTALSEVRPWIGATISVAQLQIERDLKLIDCSKNHARDSLMGIIDHTKSREDGIWIAIDRAFATPVSKEEEARNYIPTQILAELFKFQGYDGLVYKSLLSVDGFNMALFNLDDANVINCTVCKLDSIEFKFNETGPHVLFGP